MTKSQCIATMNDQLRRSIGIFGISTSHLGRVMLSAGIAALDPETIEQIVAQVREFDEFSEDNDPYGERDFGAFEFAGSRIFWKVDYYDRNLKYGSEDPADSEATTRILTIMFAEEY